MHFVDEHAENAVKMANQFLGTAFQAQLTRQRFGERGKARNIGQQNRAMRLLRQRDASGK